MLKIWWLVLGAFVFGVAYGQKSTTPTISIHLTIEDCEFVKRAEDPLTGSWSQATFAAILRQDVFSAPLTKNEMSLFLDPTSVILMTKIRRVGCRAFVPMLVAKNKLALPTASKRAQFASSTSSASEVSAQIAYLRQHLSQTLSAAKAQVKVANQPTDTAARVPQKVQLNYNFRVQVQGRKLVNSTRPFSVVRDQSGAGANANQTDNAQSISWALDRITAPYGDNVFSYPANYPLLPRTTIYHIDTGIRATHTEFLDPNTQTSRAAVIWDAYPSQPIDGNFHGTFTMSNAIGNTFGTCKWCVGRNLRALDNTGSGVFSDVEAAIWYIDQHCQANHIKRIVVSMSLGGGSTTDTTLVQGLAQAMNAVRLHCDALFVVSAGNEYSDACQILPAGLTAWGNGHTVTVGATTVSDTFASFSNYGNCVPMLAPGENIIGACATSDTAVCGASGTSMSAPFVAGVAAAHMGTAPTTWTQSVGPELSTQYVMYSTLVRFHLFNTAQNGYIAGTPTGTSNRLVQFTPSTYMDYTQYYTYNTTEQQDLSQIVYVPDPPADPGVSNTIPISAGDNRATHAELAALLLIPLAYFVFQTLF